MELIIVDIIISKEMQCREAITLQRNHRLSVLVVYGGIASKTIIG